MPDAGYLLSVRKGEGERARSLDGQDTRASDLDLVQRFCTASRHI